MTDPKEYGKALFMLAEERGSTEAIKVDAECLIEVFAQNPDYVRLLDTPALTKDERLLAIDESLAGLDKDLRNLVKIFSEIHSVYNLIPTLKCYLEEYDISKGIIRMEVISAIPLNDSERERLQKRLEGETGGTVILKETVDPSILGGLIIRGMGKQEDCSLASRLRAIARSITEAVV